MQQDELNPWQLSALARASARSDGAFVPSNDGEIAPDLQNHIDLLILAGFAVEIEVADSALAWLDHQGRPIGIIVTDIGREAIEEIELAVAHEPAPTSKIGTIIERLQRPDGAPLKELATVTGWQLHSVRAALTSLRKRGLVIERFGARSGARYRMQETGQ